MDARATAVLRPATDVAAPTLRESFNAAFSDYLIGPPDLKFADWPLFLRRQGVDLGLSWVALRGDAVLAFALICPIDATRERLATMGAIPAARGTGAAPRLLDHALAQARARGVATFELEVFAQNTRALALYRSRRFEPIAELFGYERAPGTAAAPHEMPRAIALDDAAAWLRALPLDGVPFQVSAAAIEAYPTPLTAWRSGSAQIVFSVRDATTTSIVSLIDRDPSQRSAQALVRALVAAYPQATLRVPQLQRLDLGGRALEALGCARLPQHQLLMRRLLRDVHG